MEPNENYVKGCKELEYKNYGMAIDYFSKAIKENPDDLDSLISTFVFWNEAIALYKEFFKLKWLLK